MSHTTAASRLRGGKSALVLAVMLVLALAGTAQATTYTVTNTNEFVTAVGNANSNPGPDTIQLNHAPGTAYLPTATVKITDALTINGSNVFGKFAGTSVQPFPSDFFVINPGVNVTFKGVTITGGGGSGGFSGINDFGNLTLENSTVSGNGGPGITVNPGATAIIRNSTLSDGLDFGLIAQGTVDVFNSTIANNSNGGIDASGTVHLTNAIVAKNGFADCNVRVATSVNSLDGDSSCGVGALSSKDPQFNGSLTTANGGPTPTLALKSTSPAINAGTNSPCPTTDQRGTLRNDGLCDIGAYEFVDTTAPVLTLPADKTVEATGASGAVVTYTVTATDPDDAATVTCAPPSGSTFPLGTTTVNCTAKDTHNNTTTGSFKIVVKDTTGPVFSNVPADKTVPSPNGNPVVVNYTNPTATDAVSGPATVTCSPPSGSSFPIGTTTVTCTAADASSNSSTATFKITVTKDTTPPVISNVPADITKLATSPSGAVVTYTNPTANDAQDGPVPVTCTPPSGSTFPVGATTVTCKATDASGNTATATFKVTVVTDTTPPVISNVPADITTPATSPSGAAVTYTKPTATDDRDGPVGVTCAPASGSTFPIATTTVTCTASDAAGNVATAKFKVTVTRVPTQLSLISVLSGGLSAVQATLTAGPSNTPLAGKTVTFTAGSTGLCTATTDAAGVARCNYGGLGIVWIVLRLGYDASYDGDATYLPDSGHAGLL